MQQDVAIAVESWDVQVALLLVCSDQLEQLVDLVQAFQVLAELLQAVAVDSVTCHSLADPEAAVGHLVDCLECQVVGRESLRRDPCSRVDFLRAGDKP